jgi:hypothetical protein
MVRRRNRSSIMTPSRMRRRSRRAGRATVTDAEIDAALASRRLVVSGVMVMPFTSRPVVRRFVRNVFEESTTTPIVVYPETLANLDQAEYGVASARYLTVKFIRARAYNTTSSSGIILQETLSGFQVSSEVATGASIPAVGIGFSFATRQVPFPTSNASTSVFTIALEQAVLSNLVLDIFVEFC